MLRSVPFLLLLAFAAAPFTARSAHVWSQTVAPTNAWGAIACSANGTRLLAVYGTKAPEPIYTSTNSGATWQTNALSGVWYDVAISADGLKWAALGTGYVCTSTSAGNTWTSNSLPNVRCIAGSADGVKWVAAGGPSLFTSTNSGITWISNTIVNGSWFAVASSSDGNKLVVAGTGTFYNGPIYTSKDSGATWQSTSAPLRFWDGVASSADGSRLVAVAGRTASYAGGIYVSTNSGTNWSLTTAPDYVWASIASSADGKTLLAGTRWGPNASTMVPLYISTNFGNTWAPATCPPRHFDAVASSADGSKLFGTGVNTAIYAGRLIPGLSVTKTGGGISVAWPSLSASDGFILQQNTNLQSSGWTNYIGTINDDGTNRSASVSLSSRAKFFRMKN